MFPRNADHLADDPLARMKQAFDKSAPVHMTIAAALAKAPLNDHYDYLGERLKRAETRDTMRNAVMMCLRIISGDSGPRNRTEWLRWLENRP